MKNDQILSKVALRYQAVFLPMDKAEIPTVYEPTMPLMAFIARLRENGYCVSEELLHALSAVPERTLSDITDVIDEVYGVELNWAPLVKGWDVPTGESYFDHLMTMFANIFGEEAGFKGIRLACGHLIPEGTFPLERYNGCPFCGTPFHTADFVYHSQGSQLKELRLFTMTDMGKLFRSLLESPVPLEATQLDSLKLLLTRLEIPDNIEIPMKESRMAVVHALVEKGRADQVQHWLGTPTDILRYLWYEKTGLVQLIEPKTLVAHEGKVYRHRYAPVDQSEEKAEEKRQSLLLKYDRKTCWMVAGWLNALPMTARQAAEDMNPKRNIWVRFIHALRLGEYSRRKGFEPLKALLEVFYHKDYDTWMGKLEAARLKNSKEEVFALLSARPGMFARCLFATMLRFGPDDTLQAFEGIVDQLPARLVLSLGNAAETYFDPNSIRLAHPITGGTIPVAHSPLFSLYGAEEIESMKKSIKDLYSKTMLHRFSSITSTNKTIYIEPKLYDIPVSIGDRNTTVQDSSCALQGTRFPVEGDAVRLFLQWGKGLPAQHLDMDLSCYIAMKDGLVFDCAYFNLTAPGAKHSGDIQHIPDQAGAAEYIELSLPELKQAGARYVTFTCNAYSAGALSPNLIVGWMNSAHPMQISDETGVAYDPSCVQHLVRISESNLSKGLVFGVLDVTKREILWLEMPFMGQTIQELNVETVEGVVRRLREKLSIGQLLDLKREAQHLTLVDDPKKADEAYTYEWALNPSNVNQLLSSDFCLLK